MTHDAIIKFAPVLTAERFDNPRENRAGRKFYRRLTLLPDARGVPLGVDHDLSRVIGHVDKLFRFDWTDGLWIAAHATIEEPPPWLKRDAISASNAARSGISATSTAIVCVMSVPSTDTRVIAARVATERRLATAKSARCISTRAGDRGRESGELGR